LADVPAVALLLARTRALNPQFQLTEDNAADLAAICVRLDVAQAHAAYFRAFAEQASQQYYGPHVAEWAARTQQSHDNLRAALGWFIDYDPSAEQALQLGSAMYRFWHLRGYYSEGLQWLERVLAKSSAIASPLRAEVLSHAGFLASALGQIDRAITLFETCLALCQIVDAPNTKTAALNGLGIIFNRQGHPRGIALLEEAAALARELHNPARLCGMLRALANALVTDGREIERGIEVYEEALALAREIKLVRSVALILAGLGSALTFTGQYARARPLLLEGLALQQELNDVAQMAWSFLFLGVLSYLQDAWLTAQQYFTQGLAVVTKVGNLNCLPDLLEGMAGVAAAQRKPVRAARLLGAAEPLRTSLTLTRSPVANAYYDHILSATRAQLPEEALRDHWDAGRRLTAKQAILEAEAFARDAASDSESLQRGA
jgi:non-specific serine/threonine protein kinase